MMIFNGIKNAANTQAEVEMMHDMVNRGIFLMNNFNSNMDRWRKEIKADYQKTFSMPRKMKKQRRKELLLDWNIANYDPF